MEHLSITWQWVTKMSRIWVALLPSFLLLLFLSLLFSFSPNNQWTLVLSVTLQLGYFTRVRLGECRPRTCTTWTTGEVWLCFISITYYTTASPWQDESKNEPSVWDKVWIWERSLFLWVWKCCILFFSFFPSFPSAVIYIWPFFPIACCVSMAA